LTDWSFIKGLVPGVAQAPAADAPISPKLRTRVVGPVVFGGIAAVAGFAAAIWVGAALGKEKERRQVEAIFTDLTKSSYQTEIVRFNGGDQRAISPCPSMTGWSKLQAPLDPSTKQGMERFVAPVFWAAEHMSLGRVAQCYEMAGEQPALVVDRNNDNYRIIATVRIYFNKVPTDVDSAKSDQWISSDDAAAFSSNSLPVAVLQYKTTRHYSTYFGPSIEVFSRAWGSPLNVHDVYECRRPGRIMGLPLYDSSCRVGPDDNSPVQALVAKAVDVDPENGKKTKAVVESLVRTAIEQHRK
jgi:hypothetical protein